MELTTYYDYEKQVYVVDGVYMRCGHQDECDCYGRVHEGEAVIAHGENGHSIDCDDQSVAYETFMCSALCQYSSEV